MSPHALRLLRQIVLGTPLVVVAGCTTPPSPSCSQPVAERTHMLGPTQLLELQGYLDNFQACERICREFDVFGVPPEAGVDAGTDDAGLYGDLVYANVQCSRSDAGADQLVCTYYRQCIGGRAPRGLRAPLATVVEGPGAWLARAAYLERASVDAFDELASALASHGAPGRLVRAARRAGADERSHARAVAGLAHARGARVPAPSRSRSARFDSLASVAADNAVEGCAREAYGALVAARQAQHASDADVRQVFGRIAVDEARHALFSHALDAWARGRLSGGEAARLDARRRARLRRMARGPLEDRATREALGLPDAAERAALLAALV